MDLAPTIAGKRRVFCCHRATLSGRFIPNSIEAVRECVEARAPRLEIDLWFLRDDAMLIFHDDALDAETTGSGPVEALDRTSARTIRFKQNEGVSSGFLEDVVEAMRGSETILQVDLKQTAPLTPGRVEAMAAALAPIREQVIVGCQAEGNLLPFAERGFRIALDPTLHWHFHPNRPPGLTPATLGVHGLWDDAPVAHDDQLRAEAYIDARIRRLVALAPVSEWMVDFWTLRHISGLGRDLGVELARHGIELAAWTLKDRGRQRTAPLLHNLFGVGVTTIITDSPAQLASYVAGGA